MSFDLLEDEGTDGSSWELMAKPTFAWKTGYYKVGGGGIGTRQRNHVRLAFEGFWDDGNR